MEHSLLYQRSTSFPSSKRYCLAKRRHSISRVRACSERYYRERNDRLLIINYRDESLLLIIVVVWRQGTATKRNPIRERISSVPRRKRRRETRKREKTPAAVDISNLSGYLTGKFRACGKSRRCFELRSPTKWPPTGDAIACTYARIN